MLKRSDVLEKEFDLIEEGLFPLFRRIEVNLVPLKRQLFRRYLSVNYVGSLPFQYIQFYNDQDRAETLFEKAEPMMYVDHLREFQNVRFTVHQQVGNAMMLPLN